MAQLQHIDGDRWRVRLYAGTDPGTGKQRIVSRSFRATGKRNAESQAAGIEKALRDDLKSKAVDHSTIAGLLDDWMAVKRRKLSPTTIYGYEHRVRKIKAQFGKMPADALTGRQIDDWYGRLLDKGSSPAEVVAIHRVLRAALRWGRKKRGLPMVATEFAEPPDHQTPEMNPPTTPAVLALLGQLPAGDDVHWSRALRLLVFTGMRRGEVVGLRWEDWTPGIPATEDEEGAPGRLRVRRAVRDVNREVTIGPTKGKRSREIPLDVAAETVLTAQQEWLRAHGMGASPWVFPNTPDWTRPRRPGWLSTAWGRWRKEKAPDLKLHDLRHHYATMLLDGGVPINTVQSWLGHADAAITLRVYGHRTKVGDRLGLEAIAGALGAGVGPKSPPEHQTTPTA